MEYRVAVVIQPKNTTDLAGTIVFGEHIKDLGTVLCMVTPEHDVIPFADNDQPKIDRMIKNILTEGDFPSLSDATFMKNSTNLPPFELSGDPSIMIVKKGGESFVHNDIEKYVETLNKITEDVEPYVMHTKYENIDRINMPYLTDEVVFWRYKENIYNENKYHSLETQIRYLLDVVCKEYADDTDRFINIINKFYACGCDPKILNWHKLNLNQINRDDKLIRLFGELSDKRHNIENIEDTLNGLKDDITEGCYIQRMRLDRGGDRFVNIKIYSNFKFPRIRGIILGYDGRNICAARFDATSKNGIPLYVAVDTWVGDKDNPPIIIAPSDSSYTMTVDTRAQFFLITDIPECVYEVLDQMRFTMEEAMATPLSTQFNGDFIKNAKETLLYNIGENTVVAQKLSIVGTLEEDLRESYMTSYRVSHRLPQLIDDVDDEEMFIIGDMEDINYEQLINFRVYDNSNNGNTILDKTITYKEYLAMAGGYPFRYPTVYDDGIDYTVETSFVKRDGHQIPNTITYTVHTRVPRSGTSRVLTPDLETNREQIHLVKSNGDMFERGTVIKAIVLNGNGSKVYDGTIKISEEDIRNGYANLPCINTLSGNITINVQIKEPNKFQSNTQTINIDMSKILPAANYDITAMELWKDGNMYINKNTILRQLMQTAGITGGAWYTDIDRYYSEYPVSFGLKYNCGAPKVEITTRIIGVPGMENLSWTRTIDRTLADINTNGIIRNNVAILDNEFNSLPYNYHYDRFLRFNHYDTDGINAFTHNNPDVIIPYGGNYEFTIKSYDAFDSVRKTVTYTVPSVFDSKMINSSIIESDLWNDLFETVATEDNMISNLKLNVGTKYAHMECILMMELEDNVPNADTKIFSFYVNEHGMVTQNPTLNYDQLNRQLDKYILYDADDLENILSRQNFTLWVRPRNEQNALFNDWYRGRVNNTFQRFDKVITRAVPKEIGINKLVSRVYMPPYINYVDDELLENTFTTNVPNNKKEEFEITLEVINLDSNEVLATSTATVKEWELVNNRMAYDKLKFPKTVNNYKTVVTMKNKNDATWTSANAKKENTVTVERTEQPWFSNANLDVIPITNLDIRQNPGASYPLDTTFWVRIENDDGDMLFEYNGKIDAGDIYNGYHRIYVPNKPEGVFTLSVIAREPNKYQSLIFRSSAEFIDNIQYAKIMYDNSKDLSLVKYELNQGLSEDSIAYIEKLVRRHHPTRKISKVTTITKGENPISTDYTSLSDLKTVSLPAGITIKLELAEKVAGDYPYIDVFFDGTTASNIPLDEHGKVLEEALVNWKNDYKWQWDLDIFNRGFDVEEKDVDGHVLSNTHYDSLSALKAATFNNTNYKSIKVTGVQPRPTTKDLYFKVKDTTMLDFDIQVKRSPEYNNTTGQYKYKITNTRERNENDLKNMANAIARLVRISNPDYVLDKLETPNGDVLWTYGSGIPSNFDRWKDGEFDANNLMISVRQDNIITINMAFKFPQYPELNFTSTQILHSTRVGDVVKYGKIRELTDRYRHMRYYDEVQWTDIHARLTLQNNAGGWDVIHDYNHVYGVSELDFISISVSEEHDPTGDNDNIYGGAVGWTEFTVDREEYNFEVTTKFTKLSLVDSRLRNHTMVQFNLTGASIDKNSTAFSDKSKVFVYEDNGAIPLANATTPAKLFYVYVPNNGIINQMVDISKFDKDTGKVLDKYEYTTRGFSQYSGNETTAPFTGATFGTPIAYQSGYDSAKYINITFKDDIVIQPKIISMTTTRKFDGDITLYRRGIKAYGLSYPMQPIDATTDNPHGLMHNIAVYILDNYRYQVERLIYGNDINKYNTSDITPENLFVYLEYPNVVPKDITAVTTIKLDKEYDTAWNMEATVNNISYNEMYNGEYNNATTFMHDIINEKYNIDITDMLNVLKNESRSTLTYGPGYIHTNKTFTISADKKTLTIETPLFAKGEIITSVNRPQEYERGGSDEFINYGDYVIAYNIYHQNIINVTKKRADSQSNSVSRLNDIMYKSLMIKQSQYSDNDVLNRDNAYDLACILHTAKRMRDSQHRSSSFGIKRISSIYPLNSILSLAFKFTTAKIRNYKLDKNETLLNSVYMSDNGRGSFTITPPSNTYRLTNSLSVMDFKYVLDVNDNYKTNGDCYDMINTLNQVKIVDIYSPEDFRGLVGAYHLSRMKSRARLDYKQGFGFNAYASNIVTEPLFYTPQGSGMVHVPNSILIDRANSIDRTGYETIRREYGCVVNGNNIVPYILNRDFVVHPIGFWCNYQNADVNKKRENAALQSLNDTILFPISYNYKTNDKIKESNRMFNNALLQDSHGLPDLYTSTELLVSYNTEISSADFYAMITPPAHTIAKGYHAERARPNILYDAGLRTNIKEGLSGGSLILETYVDGTDQFTNHLINKINYGNGVGLVKIKMYPVRVGYANTSVVRANLPGDAASRVLTENITYDTYSPDVYFEQVVGVEYYSEGVYNALYSGYTEETWASWARENNLNLSDNNPNVYQVGIRYGFSGMMHSIVSRSWDSSNYYIDGRYMVIHVEIDATLDKLKTRGKSVYQIVLDMQKVQPNLNETRNVDGVWSRDVNFDALTDIANWFSPKNSYYNLYKTGEKISTPYKDFVVKRIQRNIKFRTSGEMLSKKLIPVGEVRDNVNVTYDGDKTLPLINLKDVPELKNLEYGYRESNLTVIDNQIPNDINCRAMYTNVIGHTNKSLYEVMCKGCSDVYVRLSSTLVNKHRHNEYITESTYYTPIMVNTYGDEIPYMSGIRMYENPPNPSRFFRNADINMNVFYQLYEKLRTQRTYRATYDTAITPLSLFGRVDLVEARRYMNMLIFYAMYTGSFKGFTPDDFADFFRYLNSASDPINGFGGNHTALNRYQQVFSNWVSALDGELNYNYRLYQTPDMFIAESYPSLTDDEKYIFENLLSFGNSETGDNNAMVYATYVYNVYMKTVNTKDAGPALQAANQLVREFRESGTYSSRSTRYDNTPDDGIDIVEEWMDDINNDDRTQNDPYITKKIALQADIFNQQDPTSSRLTILAKTRVGNEMHLLVEALSLHYIYKCINYVQPSLVTIIQPAMDFLDNYKTIISIELPKDSTGYIGTWQDGYDLSYPYTVKITDMDTVSNTEFVEIVKRHKVVPNLVIGFYKPGVDPDFTTYVKKSKKSGLYLKVDTILTENKDGNRSNKSEEFYYPLFNTIGRNVERKLDLLYNNKVYFARTSGAREIILQNGASFFPNPLLDYVLSILDNNSDSKILRLY